MLFFFVVVVFCVRREEQIYILAIKDFDLTLKYCSNTLYQLFQSCLIEYKFAIKGHKTK
jgi:hypothetical protein